MPAEKVVPFRCMGEIMMISLRVGRYEKGKHLAIEMFDNDGISFARMTINIPDFPLKSNEAFIDNTMITDNILAFIHEQRLGEVRSIPGIDYKIVAFDMERLAEFDSDGVALSSIRA